MSGIVILEENIKSLRRLAQHSPEELGILMKAVLDSACGEEINEEEMPFNVQILYPVIQSSIDRMQAKSEQKSLAGKQGGRPKKAELSEEKSSAFETEKAVLSQDEKPEPNRTEPNHTEPYQKEEPTAPRKSAPRFVPPTVEQVAAYVTEKGLRMDPDRFVNFYASKGWKVGKDPMKDWQAAARGWAARDRARGEPEKPKTDYKAVLQGNYSELLRKGT